MVSYRTIGVEELDVGNGLLVTPEYIQGSLCVSKIVVVDAMVSRAKRQMVTT